jgi:hypothetical protein
VNFQRTNITTLIATISCHIQVTFQKLNTANSGESITLMVIVTCHSPIFQPWFLCVYHSLVDSNENSICSIVSIIFCYCSLIHCNVDITVVSDKTVEEKTIIAETEEQLQIEFLKFFKTCVLESKHCLL